jgi:hypothetical protein
MRKRIKMHDLYKKIQAIVKKPIFIIVSSIILLLLLTAAGYGVWTTQQSPPQPIEFNHQVHIGFGVQCLYCHPGAWMQASAGLPTNAKCWGCHQQIPIKNEEQQKLADFVAAGEMIPWVPVFIQPDFVFFNHRPHIAAELNCETCHGELSYMKIAQPQKGQNMGWCLDCHRSKAGNNSDKLARLTECATCHR